MPQGQSQRTVGWRSFKGQAMSFEASAKLCGVDQDGYPLFLILNRNLTGMEMLKGGVTFIA